jgi:hypothetical protein
MLIVGIQTHLLPKTNDKRSTVPREAMDRTGGW